MIVSDRILGRLEAFGSAIVFAFIFYFVKASSHGAQQMTYMRGVLNIPIILLQVYITREDIFPSWDKVDQCCTRGFWSGSLYLISLFDWIHDAEQQAAVDHNLFDT